MAGDEKSSLAEMIDRSASFRKKFFDDLCKENVETFILINTPCPSCSRRGSKCPAKAIVDETVSRLRKGNISMTGEIRCDGYDEED